MRCQFSAQAFGFMLPLSEGMLEPGYSRVEDRILPCKLLKLQLCLPCILQITLKGGVTGKAPTV